MKLCISVATPPIVRQHCKMGLEKMDSGISAHSAREINMETVGLIQDNIAPLHLPLECIGENLEKGLSTASR